MTPIKNVVVLGGGTSGWLTASILAKRFLSTQTPITVTLIESSDIPTIGVGEGTFPTMLDTLQYIGFDEAELFNHCHATFKQAIKFVDWLDNPSSLNQHSNHRSSQHYYHLFNAPAQVNGIDIVREWIAFEQSKPDFAHAVSAQAAICDAHLGPRKLDDPAFHFKTKYAYHLDAGKFGERLKQFAKKQLMVKHQIATVVDVTRDQQGNILALLTKEQMTIEGDFFIDCSGFASRLINQQIGAEWVDKSQQLFVDHALAIQVPYATPPSDLVSATISTAQEAGWTWDIGLQNRRGIGYVYSSRYTDHDRAEQVLRQYVGDSAQQLPVKRLSMRVGYQKRAWLNNCVAIGFAGGFMEPLEATAIAMVEAAAMLLAGLFPEHKSMIPGAAAKFNRAFEHRWEKIADFIKLHYCLSRRDDHDFWIDNRRSSSISQALAEQLSLWRYLPPNENDFANRFEMFSLASYQYILYGMEFDTQLPVAYRSMTNPDLAQKAFKAIAAQSRFAETDLPKHKALIESFRQP